jgi:peptide/nickel transport system permease protein
LKYFLVRLLRALVTILAVVSLCFIVLRLAGDPSVAMLGPDVSAAEIAAFRQRWGLDQPLHVQFFQFIWAVMHGDLGYSMRGGEPALSMVLRHVPQTLAITVPALLVSIAIGVPAGIAAALYRNTWFDRLIILVSIVGYTVPSFVLALVLALVFSVSLRWFPTGGSGTLAHLVLPVATIGLIGAAVIARYTRSAMLEVDGQPFIRTASAKGLRRGAVVRRHALPNAAVPIVTILGFMVGSTVTGAVVVETVFSWPGIGRLLVTSVAARDLAVVQVITLLVSAAMVLSNLVVDLLYGFLDPRMRASQSVGE